MKVEISVPEVVAIFKEIQEQPERIFEMIRVEIRENVGEYLSKLMDMERTEFLEREWYEHGQGEVNHRNGSYPRNFTLKGVGEVRVEVPRDRKGEFTTQIIPRSKRYEEELRHDMSVGRSRCAADEPRAILLVHNESVVISLHPVIGRKRPGKGMAATSTISEEVTMDTTMPQNPHFSKQYQKHLQCLKLGGLQPKTIEAYARAIRRIGNYFDCRIDNLSSGQLLDYFTKLLDTHSWSAVKLDLYGLKFFYTKVLGKTWNDIALVKPPKVKRIPDILSIDQVNELFAATRVLSYKVFFFTIYSMGLRLGEGVRLTVGDIDSVNMRVHIRNAKGNKDRLVPLPENTLRVLQQFWKVHKHPLFIFPSRKRGVKNARLVKQPIDRGGIQSAMKAVVEQIGVKKNFLPFASPQLRYPLAGSRR